MDAAASGTGDGEAARLRREYESSLSWRLTRPVRAAGALARRAGLVAAPSDERATPQTGGIDAWLSEVYGERLSVIDAKCAEPGHANQSPFSGVDDDLWALLLTQEYGLYPHIKASLPTMPPAGVQEIWNGRSGVPLALQSKAFFAKLRQTYADHGSMGLAESRVLDFGCGWGRLTRYLSRDVPATHLFGCDPVESMVDLCRSSGIAANFETSEVSPERLPFAAQFDLAFAFSVFTHLSEVAHERSLQALHHSLAPGGVLVLTIRPASYVLICEPLRALVNGAENGGSTRRPIPQYLFAPHAASPVHPQYMGGEMHYGETVIATDYIHARWSHLFELIDAGVLLEDPYQVVLTLRRA